MHYSTHFSENQSPIENIFKFMHNAVTNKDGAIHIMKISSSHQLYMKEVEKRKKKVRDLRAMRFKWREIGKLLGISTQRAQQIGAKKNG